MFWHLFGTVGKKLLLYIPHCGGFNMFTSIDKCLIYLSTYTTFLHPTVVMGFLFTTWNKQKGLECARLRILGLRGSHTIVNENKNRSKTNKNLCLLSYNF